MCSGSEAVIERYVLLEVVDGWLADHLQGTAGGLFTADEARRLFPKAVARWEAGEDLIALRSQALVDIREAEPPDLRDAGGGWVASKNEPAHSSSTT